MAERFCDFKRRPLARGDIIDDADGISLSNLNLGLAQVLPYEFPRYVSPLFH
jgi:hypothetical protein